ncbi:hypothetical protein BKA61DRAFT_59429 [Leptodontidium sp. MPI-SDFR-AT-0119]|nr:hypothetical protein BKA61DRAFT_59429 [Leptodontidium sp. MPI-SDFR-AT-0119]
MASKTSKLPAKQDDANVSYIVGKDPEFEAILLDGKPRARQPEPDPSESVDLVQLWDGSMESSSARTPSVTVTTTTSLPGTNFTSNPSSTRWIETRIETSGSGEDAQSFSYTTKHPPTLHLTPLDAHRWRLAHHALTKYNLKKPSKDFRLVTVNAISENMDLEDRESPLRPVWEISILFLLGAAYGGPCFGVACAFPLQEGEVTLARLILHRCISYRHRRPQIHSLFFRRAYQVNRHSRSKTQRRVAKAQINGEDKLRNPMGNSKGSYCCLAWWCDFVSVYPCEGLSGV